MGVLRSLKSAHCPVRVFRRLAPAAVAVQTKSPCTPTPYTMSLLKPEFSCVKLSIRLAEMRLSPPIVPTHRSPVRLSSASESTAWYVRPSAGRKIFHVPFSYRPSPFSVPAQMRLPSTRTQKTWLSGRPLAVVKFSQWKRGLSWPVARAVARETAMTAARASDKNLGVRLELRAADIDLLSQQGATTTAVRIMTVHTLSFHNWRVLLQFHRSLMAGGTDLFLRPCQIQGSHVAFGLRQMADSARKQHGGMHRLTFRFINVTGGTIGILGDDARMLDGGCLHCWCQ